MGLFDRSALFDRIKTSAAGIASSFSEGAIRVAGKATVETKEAAKITAVKADIKALEAEIETGYASIGKAYVNACIAGQEVTDIGVGATLRMMEPKLERKIALEKELVELEKALADSQIMQERQLVQAEVDEIKAKLDKAKANLKLDHFNDIRMLKRQMELGIINSTEYQAKVNALLS